MRYAGIVFLTVVVVSSGCIHSGSSNPLKEFEQESLTIISSSGDIITEIEVNKTAKSFSLLIKRKNLQKPEPSEGENITKSAESMLRVTCLRFMPLMDQEKRQKGLENLELSQNVRVESQGDTIREEYSVPTSEIKKIMKDYTITELRFQAFDLKGNKIGSCTLEEYGGDVKTTVNENLG